MNHLLAYSKRGPYDHIHTPNEAVDFIVPYLHELDKRDHTWPILWESAPPKRGRSRLARRLEHHGFRVVDLPKDDFFQERLVGGRGAVQVTNPPYSVKYKWIDRTMLNGQPAALLLPITVIAAKQAHQFVTHCRVILPPKRFDFVGKKRPWFYTAWFLWGWPGSPGLEKGY